MNILGYFKGNITKEQYKEFKKNDVGSLLIDFPDCEENSIDILSDEMFLCLSEGDKLIIYNLINLGKTLVELALFLKKLKDKNIELVILVKDELFDSMTDSEFFQFIFDLYEENQKIVKNKIEDSRRHRKNIGRPKVSEETIEKIRELRIEKHYSLQSTANLCDVSIGTVYKYADNQK